jgi:hypothetical protein
MLPVIRSALTFSIPSPISDFIYVALSLSVLLPVPVSTLRGADVMMMDGALAIIGGLDEQATIRGASQKIIGAMIGFARAAFRNH